jgi:SNF2 family DNA or RNA helicase
MRLGQIHHTMLPNFYLRRDKRLIADELPEKKDIVVFCPLAERQILAYQRLIQSDGTSTAHVTRASLTA